MSYIEMARDEIHGGGDWSFGKCVWAPAHKKKGGNWPHWLKVKQVRQGDTIVHLRGIPPDAHFVGYSIAASDGYETTNRPPEPGEWAFAERFLRAELSDFT